MRFLCAMAAFLLFASGCSGPGDSAADTNEVGDGGPGGDGGAPGSPDAAVPTKQETLYEHSDLVVGAGPSNPATNTEVPIPPAKVDHFTVPDGALDLGFEGGVCDGSGVGGIEVLSPGGELVWRSESAGPLVGAPGVGCGGVFWETGVDNGGVAPGEYTVNYRIGGAFTATLKVTAKMPVPVEAAPAEEAEQ